LLFCLFGYSTLNRGFAYLGYYPFFVGELALLFYLLLLNHRVTLFRFLGTTAGKIWAIFFIYCLIIFAFSALSDLNESIRDSVFWVYSIFFYIGYSYGNHLIQRHEIDRFHNVLLFLAKATVIYFALFPFREELRNLTMFLHGGTTALVGYYSTLHALSLGFVFFFLFYRRTYLHILWVVAGLVLVVAISQARASMLALGIIILYLILVHRRAAELRALAKILGIITLAAFIFSVLDISIGGQRSDVSAEFFQKAILSIFIDSNDDSLQGTREHRLEMWTDVIERTVSTLYSLLFGMGLDTILVDSGTGVDTILRYPHNSFISVFGFTGAIGIGLYVILVGHLLWVIIKSSHLTNSIPLLKWYPVFAIGYFVAAFFSTVFEAPFHSFVFWVITGVVYRAAIQNRLCREEALI